MRILLDECVPSAFASTLLPHEVLTARSAGWDNVRNGELLALAQEGFDAFVTIDKGIFYQHPPGRFTLRIVCFRPYSNKVEDVFPHASAVLSALETMREGEVRLLDRLKG